jgi:hypothetical protein
MSYTTEQYIQVKCPNLYSDSNLSVYIDAAKLTIKSENYGTKYNYAVALKACHDYSIAQIQQGIGTGSSGTISSKKEGDLSVNFENNLSNITGDDYLKLTNYGIELLALQNGQLIRFDVVGTTQTEPTYFEL